MLFHQRHLLQVNTVGCKFATVLNSCIFQVGICHGHIMVVVVVVVVLKNHVQLPIVMSFCQSDWIFSWLDRVFLGKKSGKFEEKIRLAHTNMIPPCIFFWHEELQNQILDPSALRQEYLTELMSRHVNFL